MAPANAPPSLQIAQILADLSDLNVAEPEAALALVTAPQHLHLSRQKSPSNSKTKPPLSSFSSYISQDGSGGSQRRSDMTSPPPLPLSFPTGTLSRTLSRNDSTSSGMSGFERFHTPSPGGASAADEADPDPDLERAGTLMQLYAIRNGLVQQQQQENGGGLARARANVEAVAERYGRLVEGREAAGR